MSVQRVAVVTGANRGIGLEISRQLALRGMQVLLTSRDEARGRVATEALTAQGLDVTCRQLDVTNVASVAAFRQHLERSHARVDVLVNNAGILIEHHATTLSDLDTEVLRATLETNTIAVLRVTRAVLPLMRKAGYGRIVNLSSGLGQLSDMQSGTPAYRISKTALNAVTRILAAELSGADIKVNAMCPGWVRTDMGGPNAERSVEQGADTAVWLATLPKEGPSGGFFRDREPIPW
jgi:NAD(P)-dependent dehydrogenase (short-subunit alcohol dehydrogenase family)